MNVRNRIPSIFLLFSLTASLLFAFVVNAASSQVISVSHTFYAVTPGGAYRNAILTQRCVEGRYHWLTSEELAPRQLKFGPWRYTAPTNNSCAAHYPYLNMTTETVKICVGAATVAPAATANLYEQDSNRCHICKRTENGTGSTLDCTEVFNVTGKVVTSQGAPLDGVQVTATPERTVLTDAGGVYRFRDLPKASLTLSMLKSGYAFSPTVQIGGDAAYNVTVADVIADLQTPPVTTVTIAGAIVDADGGPVPGVAISVGGRQTASGQDGRFVLTDLFTGTAVVQVTRAGTFFLPVSRTLELTSSMDGIDFVATNRYSLRGHLTDSAGAALGSARVTCMTTGERFDVLSDGLGAYRCSDLKPGLYSVAFENQRRGWWQLPPGWTSVDFTLAPLTGAVTGIVRNRTSGQPLAGATILSVDAGVRAVTATDGSYTLRLRPGAQTLQATAPGYVDSKRAVTVTIGLTTLQTIDLAPIVSTGFRLPFTRGSQFYLTQGNNQFPSHVGTWAYAFDFGMRLGADVAASRDGRVVTVVDNFSTSCQQNTRECRNSANYIRIRHVDGTDTLYYHLLLNSAAVKVGDWVTTGQVIAKADTTGFVLGSSHLDFTRHAAGGWVSIPISFLDVATVGGIPRVGQLYRSNNPPDVAAAELPLLQESPPIGDVALRIPTTGTVVALLSGIGMAADVNALRIATSTAELEQSPWISTVPQVAWSAPAVFVQFRDEGGRTSGVMSETLNTLVYAPLQAGFVLSPTACTRSPIALQNTTTPFCEQCGWQWDFGNGVTSTEADPLFDYTGARSFFGYETPGVYTITLGVTGYETASTVTHTVTVTAAPSNDFVISRDGVTVTVAAAQTTAADWRWDFGDGAVVSGMPTVTHVYSDLGQIDVAPLAITLTITGTDGCMALARHYVPPLPEVAPLPQIYLPVVISQTEEQ